MYDISLNPLLINMGFWMMLGVFTLALNILLSVWDRCLWGFTLSMLMLSCVLYVHTLDLFLKEFCVILTAMAFTITMYSMINNRR